MLFRVEVDQVDHIFLTFAMYYKYHLTYQPLLMETTFDVCSYLEKFKNRGYASVAPSLDQTAMFILSILEKNNPTAIRTGCPYKVGRTSYCGSNDLVWFSKLISGCRRVRRFQN